MAIFLYAFLIVLSIVVIFCSKQLSMRYNAWTTSFRERNPHINPPPTPEMRALNTKIMTRLFRILGVFLFLLAGLMLIGNLLLAGTLHSN
jgi:hypothetical protein